MNQLKERHRFSLHVALGRPAGNNSYYMVSRPNIRNYLYLLFRALPITMNEWTKSLMF